MAELIYITRLNDTNFVEYKFLLPSLCVEANKNILTIAQIMSLPIELDCVTLYRWGKSKTLFATIKD